MFKNVVALNNQVHLNKRVKDIADFRFAQQMHVAYVTVQEFARCAPTYPIVFLEDTAKDQFRPVALLGLRVGSNLFVDGAGRWQASYVPAVVRRYPFALTRGQGDDFVVCIDDASDLVTEDEGAALFDIHGAPTAVIDNVKSYLSELQRMETSTLAFCEFLATHNMLVPLNLQVRENGETKTIAGCYVINEERLNKLSDELFVTMKQRGFLPAIYAHLLSIAQTERLVKLQEQLPAEA